LQHGVSGAVALLPSTVGRLAGALAGLDPEVAALVDGQATSYAALSARGANEAAWALAFPIHDGGRAAAVLFPGDAGAGSSLRSASTLRVVPPAGPATGVTVALARSWLLLASDDRAAQELGPYVYRTLPTKQAPPSDAAAVIVVPRSALAGPISAALLRRWDGTRAWLAASDEAQRAKHGGHAPDFGDSHAILEGLDVLVRRPLAVVTEAAEARIEVDVGDDNVRADATVIPGDTGEAGTSLVETMHPGDVRPLGLAPADSLAAVLLRDNPADRTASARDVTAALERGLGDRVQRDDARAMETAFEDWARGRGEWLTAALAWGPSRGIWVRAPAQDADTATRSVRELVGLLRRPAFGDPLDAALSLGPVSLGATQVNPFGRAGLATFAPFARRHDSPDGALGIAWGVRDGDLFIAAGGAAPALLAREASPAATLGEDPAVARAISGVGSDAAFALVAQPLRLDPARADGATAPAVVAIGRRGSNLWGRLDVSDVLLRELVHLNAGF
jgi:hypothetical protein